MLESIKEPISIITIAGGYREGKSFLLNRLLLRVKKGFETSKTVNACTKGIWVWNKPLEAYHDDGRPINLLVMDTEGFSSTEADTQHDLNIFTIAILTCTHLIYNSMKRIDESAVTKLSISVKIASELKGKSGAALTSQDYNKIMPHFTWVVRDFDLELSNP